MRYVAGTLGYGLWCTYTPDNTLTGYTYSDFGRSIDDRKNTFGYAFHLGTNLISWAFEEQPIENMSSTEAEYVVTTTTTYHAIWIRILLKDRPGGRR